MIEVTSLELKDFFPLIGVLASITAGYYFLSTQARKNRQLRWIEDFIKEVANFSVLSSSISVNYSIDIKQLLELQRSVTTLKLYVYPLINPQEEYKLFVIKLQDIQNLVSEETKNEKISEQFKSSIIIGNLMAELLQLATEIIKIEQSKL